MSYLSEAPLKLFIIKIIYDLLYVEFYDAQQYVLGLIANGGLKTSPDHIIMLFSAVCSLYKREEINVCDIKLLDIKF